MTGPVRSSIAALLFAAATAATGAAGPPTPVEIGESIYLHGIGGSGQPLQAAREGGGGTGASGAAAACVNCHQRSGLGATHQYRGIGGTLPSNQIPPVAGRYLFEPVMSPSGKPILPYVDGMRTNRSPYTEATLARAIREGIDADGHALGYLMPRFAIGDADLSALIAYLKTIDPTHVPGVTDTTLHFATIITPDTDPARRKAMLQVIESYFAERNARQMKPSAQLQASGRTQYSRSMFMVHRQWQLHVWELTGPASGWSAQLNDHFAHGPVLAVISGLGRDNWVPVHDFCEHKHLPCLFPNVDVPVDAHGDFFEIYFTRGVLLEADLIAGALRDAAARSPVKVVRQIYRAGDSGEAGARALAKALKARGVDVRDTALSAQDRDPAAAVRASSGADALVLWLRADDLAALGDVKTAPPLVYLSGQLGGLEAAPLPAAWRPRTHMAYPVDLPGKRVVRVDYPMGWFRITRIPVIDELMQTNTYLACGLLSEALKDMTGTFYGPYLIEEIQTMVEHRLVTGYYPRLSLAENQHFASKGGYLVHFEGETGAHIAADGDWIVP